MPTVFDRITFTDSEREQAKARWEKFRAFHADIFAGTPDCREKSLALTKLQECLFWCEAAQTAAVKASRE